MNRHSQHAGRLPEVHKYLSLRSQAPDPHPRAFSAMFVVKQLVSLALLVPSALCTVAQIQTDITTIRTSVTTLNNNVAAFTASSGLIAALVRHAQLHFS